MKTDKDKSGNQLRAALYIRVSTERQALEGYSIAAQTHNLTRGCEMHGYEVTATYIDEGLSGKDIVHRPGLLKLLAEAKNGQFDVVYFWSLSRLTRSVADLYDIYQKLSKKGVEIRSHTEPIDTTTPVGRAVMGVLVVFAQMEREITSERIYYAMEERARQRKHTAMDTLGYDVVDGELKVNVDESERVKYIFEKYLEYKNIAALAELCIAKGYIGKRGGVFSIWTILKVLTRPVYCGYNSFDGALYKGFHEPIISVKIFNKVQELLAGRKGTAKSYPIITGIDGNAKETALKETAL
jgi:site-specific DNA recombinase